MPNKNHNVGLRALEPEDLDMLYAVENDPTTWASTATAAYYSRYVLKQYIASASNDINTDGQLRLVATLCDDEKASAPTPIGLADLTSFDPIHQRAEIGLILLPQYRGLGLAVPTIQCLVEHARRLHLHQLWATVATTNEPANIMLQQTQFTPSAILTEWLRTDTSYVDARIWQRIL